ncbi:hypothetical protein [Glaciibacter superstes]|uniref:hypothetical protein n=1 Tax=Glaciibacter superstes TaxID=501023 RepID=UPI0003B7801A|nr:hypothetical protein [Glaciibacter superstes]
MTTTAIERETTPMTSTPAMTRPLPSPFARIWNVVRLHLVDRRTYIGIPWIIVAFAFLISIVLSNIIGFVTGDGLGGAEATANQRYSWAVLAPQWYLIVVAVQSIGLTFPFALGFSVTRRDFYLGTSLMFVLISAFNAVAFAVLTQIEKVTDGWWMGTYMFNALWFGVDGWYVDLLSFFVLQLLVFFIGASVTTIYMRWRIVGMLVFAITVAVVVLGTLSLITFTSSWPAVATWFGQQGIAGIFLWLLVPTVLAAVGGYVTLRRATPKN